MMDNGSSYKGSSIVSSKELRRLLKEDPETTIFSHGLLHALNVKPMFCKKNSPWSKPIERVFETIEKRWFRHLPGFCGGRKKSRYLKDPEFALKRLKEKDCLWTIEKFADYWFNRVVPEYCNYGCRGKASPMQKYKSLPRANTLAPSWATLAIFMQQKRKAEVTKQGIFYNNILYDDLALTDYIGENVFIYSFNNAYTDSICAVYSNPKTKVERFIGEIKKKEVLKFVEEDKVKLSRNLVIHNLQVANIKSSIDVIHTISDLSNTYHSVFIDWSIQNHEVLPYIFGQTPVPVSDTPSVHISKEALKVAMWLKEKELEILKCSLQNPI